MNLGRSVFCAQLGLQRRPTCELPRRPLLSGGPVQTDQGFVLPQPGWRLGIDRCRSRAATISRLRATSCGASPRAAARQRGRRARLRRLGRRAARRRDGAATRGSTSRRTWKLLFDTPLDDRWREASAPARDVSLMQTERRRGPCLSATTRVAAPGRGRARILTAAPAASASPSAGLQSDTASPAGTLPARRGADWRGESRPLSRGSGAAQRAAGRRPYNMDGSDTVADRRLPGVRGDELAQRASLPVELVDERPDLLPPRLPSCATRAAPGARAPRCGARTSMRMPRGSSSRRGCAIRPDRSGKPLVNDTRWSTATGQRRPAAASAHARWRLAARSCRSCSTSPQFYVRLPGDPCQPVDQSLAGRTVANLFFEPSTRTRVSFELAGAPSRRRRRQPRPAHLLAQQG